MSIKTPKEGNIFFFILGLIIIVVIGFPLFKHFHLDLRDAAYLAFGAYLIIQNGVLQNTANWKVKPILLSVIVIIICFSLLFIYSLVISIESTSKTVEPVSIESRENNS